MEPQEPDATPPRPSSRPPLKKRAVRGASVATIGMVVGQIVRLAGNIVTARFLSPEAYGVMALVAAVLQGLELMSDLGIMPAIVQSKRGDDEAFLNTAFTINAIRGGVVFLIGVLVVAPAFAWYYEQAQLFELIAVTVTQSLMGGLLSTKLATLERKIKLEGFIYVDLASHFIGVLAMCISAYILRSVWALVIGVLVIWGVKAILSHVALPGPRNRFVFERAAAREIFSFGKWIFVSTAIHYLAMNADIFILKKLEPDGVVGVFQISRQLAQLPILLGMQVVSMVLMPALSESHRKDRATLQASFAAAQSVILPIGLFVCLGMALLGPSFFWIAYDDRYADARWMIQLIVLSIWFGYLEVTAGRALLAVGDSRSLAAASAAKLIFTVTGAFAGYGLFGVPGFIVGLSLGTLAANLMVVLMLRKIGLYALKDDAVYTLLGIAIAGGASLVPPALAPIVGAEYTEWTQLGVGVAAVVPMGLYAAKRALEKVRAPG